jgi:hypothetical protein
MNAAASHAMHPSPTLPVCCNTTPGDANIPLPMMIPNSTLQLPSSQHRFSSLELEEGFVFDGSPKLCHNISERRWHIS